MIPLAVALAVVCIAQAPEQPPAPAPPKEHVVVYPFRVVDGGDVPDRLRRLETDVRNWMKETTDGLDADLASWESSEMYLSQSGKVVAITTPSGIWRRGQSTKEHIGIHQPRSITIWREQNETWERVGSTGIAEGYRPFWAGSSDRYLVLEQRAEQRATLIPVSDLGRRIVVGDPVRDVSVGPAGLWLGVQDEPAPQRLVFGRLDDQGIKREGDVSLRNEVLFEDRLEVTWIRDGQCAVLNSGIAIEPVTGRVWNLQADMIPAFANCNVGSSRYLTRTDRGILVVELSAEAEGHTVAKVKSIGRDELMWKVSPGGHWVLGRSKSSFALPSEAGREFVRAIDGAKPDVTTSRGDWVLGWVTD